MPEFSYRAADASGTAQDGRVQAATRAAALRQLRGQGLTPLQLTDSDTPTLTPAAGGGATADAKTAPHRAWRGTDRGPNATDVHHLTGELAEVLREEGAFEEFRWVLVHGRRSPISNVV